ncbi:hypothetical protein BDB00DRAFT_842245 [Zychaea mexicana]|uniref:uncharacterized protein n=1 Tax=Zychaea mexicana TaxID=64656 RepID=UPI0022FDC2AE|nr:uncharacterized protein BDB00DRAFT_842237 [Zychaea mexicana]XP_052975880.1 uncharacterized protein BDB00DRAFT_842245 [Zychaea mexicana]KAI9489614.1 hypothetical protein BDB00DRAFT_842237 [Zychaea mexicana]KAI9489615.1 hypothetical protein BDB00DRAFT_842245 [Zychaea mexicana]
MARTKKTARKVDFSATTPLSKKQALGHLAVIAVSASQDPTKFEGIPFGGYGVVCNNKELPNVSGSLFGTSANSLCIELEGIKRFIERCPNNLNVTVVTRCEKVYRFLKDPEKRIKPSRKGQEIINCIHLEINQLLSEKNITLFGAFTSNTEIKALLYPAAFRLARKERKAREVTADAELAKAYDEQEMQQLNEHASLMQGASSTSYLQQQQQQSIFSNTYLQQQQQLLVPSDMQLQQLLSQLPQSQQRESPSSGMQPSPTATYVQTTVSSGPASIQADVKPPDAHANPGVHRTNNNNNNNSNDITIISDDDDDDGDELYVDAVDYTGWTDLERKRPQIRTVETMN